MKFIGRNLREARLAAGLTQSELARRAGYARTTICYLENNYREGNLQTFYDLAQALRIPFKELFDES